MYIVISNDVITQVQLVQHHPDWTPADYVPMEGQEWNNGQGAEP